mgnify:CR=1 FL=1
MRTFQVHCWVLLRYLHWYFIHILFQALNLNLCKHLTYRSSKFPKRSLYRREPKGKQTASLRLASSSRLSTWPVGNVLDQPYQQILHSNRHFHAYCQYSFYHWRGRGSSLILLKHCTACPHSFRHDDSLFFWRIFQVKLSDGSWQISGDPDWH